MKLGVTQLGAVDAWECDQMQHLNVRFYGARFTDAEVHAFAKLGMPARPSLDDELRFSREIRCGAAVRVETTQLSPLRLEHLLFDGDSEAPSASLKACYESPGSELPGFEGSGWAVCARSVIKPSACDSHGLSREGTLGLVNHAAAHLGLDRHRQREADGRLRTGSATVACRIRRYATAAAGTLVEVESRIGSAGRRSVRLQHRIVDSASAQTLAHVEITVVFFDMATRRAVPLPEALQRSGAGAAQ